MYTINQLISGKINKIAFGGDGILKHEGFVFFVPYAAPGDELQIQIDKLKKNYGHGTIQKIESMSTSRTTPKCVYFGTCGGCQLQHITYEKELELKKLWIEEAFFHFDRLKNVTVHPVNPSPKEYHYRKHVTLSIKQDLDRIPYLGFVKTDQKSLIKVNSCKLFIEDSESLLSDLQNFVKNLKIQDDKSRINILKDEKNDYLLHFHFKIMPTNAESYLEDLFQKNKRLIGIIASSEKKTYRFGQTKLTTEIEDLKIEFSTDVFMQNNLEQSLNIYKQILQIAKHSNCQEALDLYCGIGISSLMLAKNGIKVTGIEYNKHSIKTAIKNSQLNQLKNTVFQEGSVENLIENKKIPDFVIINPPREGLDPRVIDALKKQLPQKIIYISCMPSTLARDLNLLLSNLPENQEYFIKSCTPYDMFPKTTHVETVVEIVKIIK